MPTALSENSEVAARLAARTTNLQRDTSFSGIVLVVICWARAPGGGGVTRQGVVLTDLQSLLDCQ